MKNNDPLFSIHYEQEPSRAKSADKTDLQLQYENDPYNQSTVNIRIQHS